MVKSYCYLEAKLKFDSSSDRALVISAMKEYTQIVRYGIKVLRPKLQDCGEAEKILSNKFPQTTKRIIHLLVRHQLVPMMKCYGNIQAKHFPLQLRLDAVNSKYYIIGDKIRFKFIVKRANDRTWGTQIDTEIAGKRCLTYKYYKAFFATKKEHRLPSILVYRNGQVYSKISIEKQTLIAPERKQHVNVGIDLNAFWVGKKSGNPLAIAYLKDDNTFARQPLLIHEWAEIPKLIRDAQHDKKNPKKVIENQLGLVIKRILSTTNNYDATFKLEDLSGLSDVRGAYSKFFYRKFANMLSYKSLEVLYVDPRYTSQTCSRCGKIGIVKGRVFTCPSCYPKGFHRDINAAINIAKKECEQTPC